MARPPSANHTFMWNGTSWSASPATTSLSSVSCVSASFCFAVTPYVDLEWNGTSWSSPQPLGADNTSVGHSAGVSCPNVNLCVAVYANGSAIIGRR